MDIGAIIGGLVSGINIKSWLIGAVMGSFGSFMAVYLINKVILSTAVIMFLVNHFDDFMDAFQRVRPKIGKALRGRLIIGFRAQADELEKDDGTNMDKTTAVPSKP